MGYSGSEAPARRTSEEGYTRSSHWLSMGYSGSEAPERRTSEEGYTRSSFRQLFSSSRPLIQAIHSRNSRTNIWENNLNFKKLVTHYRTYQLINCQVLVERRKGNPINENVICMVTNSSVCLYLSSKIRVWRQRRRVLPPNSSFLFKFWNYLLEFWREWKNFS